jgi:hypothetical protein
MDSDYNGCVDVVWDGQTVYGLQMASKASISICDIELGKPNMFPENPGSDPVRVNDGIVGKRNRVNARMTSCNEVHRGSKLASARKGADPIVAVFHCMKGGRM